MPTSKDSPTSGEVTQNDVPSATEPNEGPVETNFPDVDPTQPQETASVAPESDEPKPGEVWATYTGQQPSQRILTVADLKSIGDKNAEEPLVWDRNNRFRREISDVHPMVLEYIEHLDGGFKVVRSE